MSKIKNCPFCGSENVSHCEGVGHNHYVQCMNCRIRTASVHTDGKNNKYLEAIKAWNNRHAKPVSKEDLAEYCHDEQWSGWMKYLFEKTIEITGGHIVIPKWAVERWTRQMNTKYKDLPDEEKESDIKEAEAIINKYSVHERNE